MVTAAKAALDLHGPSLFVSMRSSRAPLLVGSSITLVRDLSINALPKPFALFVPCSAAPPADTRMVKVPHEDQGLQTWRFFQLSEEGLFYFFLIRGSIADTQNNFAHVVLLQQLPVASSSIPRQSSMLHSCCCLINDIWFCPLLSVFFVDTLYILLFKS